MVPRDGLTLVVGHKAPLLWQFSDITTISGWRGESGGKRQERRGEVKETWQKLGARDFLLKSVAQRE